MLWFKIYNELWDQAAGFVSSFIFYGGSDHGKDRKCYFGKADFFGQWRQAL